MIPWINMSQFAGQESVLTFRLSSPDDTEGAITIDDLIFARIENQKNFDFNRDTLIDIQDAGLILKLITGQDLPGPLTGPNMTPIGQQELIHIIQKSVNQK